MPSFIRNPRRSPRLPIRLRAEVAHRDESWTTETENVGPGGCSMVSTRPLVAHAPLRITIRTDLVDEPLRIAGNVAWSGAGRGGVAFDRPRFALRAGPDAWFKLLLAAQPQLLAALQRIPVELAADAPVYLAQPRRERMGFTPDEATLVTHARQGILVDELLHHARLGVERGPRALFSLLERGVLTLAMGEAGEAWRWKAVIDPSSAASPRPVVPLTRCGRGARQRARAFELSSPPVLTRAELRADAPRSLAPPLPAPRAAGAAPNPAAPARSAATPLRLVTPPQARSPAALQQLEAARVAIREGRERDATKLLRSAQVIAPDDAEIAQLLGELTTRSKIRG